MESVGAAESESGDAVERGQAEDGGLANPGGVGREVVEENSRVAGEAPVEGAAERGCAGGGRHRGSSGKKPCKKETNARWRWQSFLRRR